MQERHMCGRCFYAATMPAMVGRRTVLKLAATATAGLGFLPRALAQIAKEPSRFCSVAAEAWRSGCGPAVAFIVVHPIRTSRWGADPRQNRW
jgi:hypothetical protein